MTFQDWKNVIGQAAAAGVGQIQFIGGEATLHPDAPALVAYARDLGLSVEVYSNLVHVTSEWWDVLTREGVSLATSYYSADPAEHNAMTGRPSHRATRANIITAVGLGIPLRVGIVTSVENPRVEETRAELHRLGVTRITVDHVRPFGRGADGRSPDVSGLCSQCGGGKASVGPDGTVSPCVFSTWMSVGNVHDQDLTAILDGADMAQAKRTIRDAPRTINDCDPDGDCSPGVPDSGCSPRT